jgi:hypothetical protein
VGPALSYQHLAEGSGTGVGYLSSVVMVRFEPQGQESIGAIVSWIRKQGVYSEPPFVSTGSEVIDELVEKDP